MMMVGHGHSITIIYEQNHLVEQNTLFLRSPVYGTYHQSDLNLAHYLILPYQCVLGSHLEQDACRGPD